MRTTLALFAYRRLSALLDGYRLGTRAAQYPSVVGWVQYLTSLC